MLDKRNEKYIDYIRDLLNSDNGEFTGSITINAFKNVIGNVKRKPESFEPAINFEETVVLKR
jgi:hypothetical protein